MKIMDEQIRNAVLKELEWDPKISSNDIGIAVEDSVVALSGFASSFWEKDAAENAVKRVNGVRGVANDIEVKSTGQTDPEIARNIVHAFEVHTNIPDDKLKVTVENGWVTLEGNVDWQYQKSLAESEVKKVKGVIGIGNNIKIAPRVSSANVKNEIEQALRRSAEVDARGVIVNVEDNTVKLYGSVRAFVEKEEAERAAWASPGVAKVDNHIQINP